MKRSQRARSKRGCTPSTKSIASRTRIQRGRTATSAMKQTSFISSSRSLRGSRPRIFSSPSNGISPSIAFSAVVLPAPLGPMRPTMRPAWISNEVPSSASLFLYALRRPRALTTVSWTTASRAMSWSWTAAFMPHLRCAGQAV
jgi:hypothetical protein